MSWEGIAIRLAVALLLGSLIGLERQWYQKMAGLRTNALVGLGAGGFVVFSAMYPTQSDPTRMAAQIVSGIGFLGAGVILREGTNVHGLNTAATLWCSAMVGTLAGGGFWLASALAGGVGGGPNLFLPPPGSRPHRRPITPNDNQTHYPVEVTCKGSEEAHIRSLLLHGLSGAGLGLRRIDSEDIPDTSKVSVTAKAMSATRNDAALEQIVGRLSLEQYVSAATWQVERAIPEA